MNQPLKVILSVTIAMVALALLEPGPTSRITVNAQVTNTSDCNGNMKPTDFTQWDHCTTAGSFKSKSYCYNYMDANGNPQYVYKYDWYKCVSSSACNCLLLYRENCTAGSTLTFCQDADSSAR